MRFVVAALVPLAAVGVAVGVVCAPVAAADCNDSSGTTVCAQGDIRGTHGKPPTQPIRGAWGVWCSGGICYPGFTGIGIALGP